MKRLSILYLLVILSVPLRINAQNDQLLKAFQSPPESARPWVFWYWMQAAVSREGITADLEAMKSNGIGGVYLVPIKGVANPPLITPAAEQLSPEWWKLLRFAFTEANRLGIKIAMHASDGFATAGGPWITPELSMQKLVWTETRIHGGQVFKDTLPQPESYRMAEEKNSKKSGNASGYYEDIAILAFPTPDKPGQSTQTIHPKVTTSNKADATFLPTGKGKDTFKSESPCWIQYKFDKPFTCRSITIVTGGNNYQAHRPTIEVSDDSINFRYVTRLTPARHGWFDYEDDATYAIKPVTARYFRFHYNKEGSEPAAEDLNNAKWKPNLKVKGIILSSAPAIHQYEGKNGQVWRVAGQTTSVMVPDSLCVSPDQIVDLTGKVNSQGKLVWHAPAGNWTILRIGHTSTGRKNETGGAAKGLECDKLNPEAVKFQYNHWFGEITKEIGPDLTSKVLKNFHVDSWECGSQNWSPVFRKEFKKRRGYDLLKYLPAMAGIPVISADASERFLHDVRQTISELLAENFYGTLTDIVHSKGFTFTAESVAPVMLSDGMLHYKYADVPMGEFWVNSPSHDKPADMFDAVSGGHIYGRNIIQAEAFTTLRMDWSENPSMLKTLQDRNYALGANRFVYHVFAHNPWLDRKPGMTLDGVGLYFQRDQTWWKPGKAWVEYAQRCQALLQMGVPVTDIAVFTGEENPRRALTPDRLVESLPGIVGSDRVESETLRLANKGVPTQTASLGVSLTANMYDPAKWTDPLLGYAYDSFNADVLLRLATVKNGRGRVELPGGASYGVLVLPGHHPMMPDGKAMSTEIATRIVALVKDGANLVINEKPDHTMGLQSSAANDQKLSSILEELWKGKPTDSATSEKPVLWNVGKGHVIQAPYLANSFQNIGLERDLAVTESSSAQQAKEIAWNHRAGNDFDLYFLSNQQDKERIVDLSLRVHGRLPEIWNPVTGETQTASDWKIENGRTILSTKLSPNGSLFVVLQRATTETSSHQGKNWKEYEPVQKLEGSWQVLFDPKAGGPEKPVTFESLQDWSRSTDTLIRFYSGTATYSKTIEWNAKVNGSKQERVWLDLGETDNIAEVKVNGVDCGVAWTAPYRVEITKALKPGENQISIDVTNTWANRLIGDQALPEKDRITHTTAPFRLEGKALLKAGLLGPVMILR